MSGDKISLEDRQEIYDKGMLWEQNRPKTCQSAPESLPTFLMASSAKWRSGLDGDCPDRHMRC